LEVLSQVCSRRSMIVCYRLVIEPPIQSPMTPAYVESTKNFPWVNSSVVDRFRALEDKELDKKAKSASKISSSESTKRRSYSDIKKSVSFDGARRFSLGGDKDAVKVSRIYIVTSKSNCSTYAVTRVLS
jgi:hypothetical protein